MTGRSALDCASSCSKQVSNPDSSIKPKHQNEASNPLDIIGLHLVLFQWGNQSQGARQSRSSNRRQGHLLCSLGGTSIISNHIWRRKKITHLAQTDTHFCHHCMYIIAVAAHFNLQGPSGSFNVFDILKH